MSNIPAILMLINETSNPARWFFDPYLDSLPGAMGVGLFFLMIGIIIYAKTPENGGALMGIWFIIAGIMGSFIFGSIMHFLFVLGILITITTILWKGWVERREY